MKLKFLNRNPDNIKFRLKSVTAVRYGSKFVSQSTRLVIQYGFLWIPSNQEDCFKSVKCLTICDTGYHSWLLFTSYFSKRFFMWFEFNVFYIGKLQLKVVEWSHFSEPYIFCILSIFKSRLFVFDAITKALS